MGSIADESVHIQTSSELQFATPSWLREVALVASHLQMKRILPVWLQASPVTRNWAGCSARLSLPWVKIPLCSSKNIPPLFWTAPISLVGGGPLLPVLICSFLTAKLPWN